MTKIANSLAIALTAPHASRLAKGIALANFLAGMVCAAAIVVLA